MGLVGCAGPTVQDYADQKPMLDLKTYFNGVVDAWGIFTDRNGKVVKRFTVEMKCQWNNDQGILDEDFVYSDGTTEKRIWKLTDKGNGAFTGTAGDVVGIALGQAKGNAFNWSYTLALPVDGSIINVQMDDWMYLMNDRVMLNKARMTKLGIHLGDVTLSFMKRA
jgi:NOL1/NOP2/fmu family ribosome biogenesis protein